MSDEAARSWRVREYKPDDLEAYVRLHNLEYTGEPVTVEQQRHGDESFPQDNPRLRLVTEDEQGHCISFGDCLKPFWANVPGVYMVFILTDPARRGEGIGRDQLSRMSRYASAQGAEKLWTDCRESQSHSIRFLEQADFRQYGIRYESGLRLADFDADQFAPALRRAEQAGYRLTTLAERRRARPDADRELYEVHHEGMQDVPLPGGMRIDVAYDQWRKGLDSPTVDPEYVFLALKDDALVGMTAFELLKDGPAITDSTAVLRAHRGQGVALALKVASLIAVKALGYAETRTQNDVENPAILHLNDRLGYQRLPGWMQWEKLLP